MAPAGLALEAVRVVAGEAPVRNLSLRTGLKVRKGYRVGMKGVRIMQGDEGH
jgi:hypothetical protein